MIEEFINRAGHGHFVSQLLRCFSVADQQNQHKLAKAFPKWFELYSIFFGGCWYGMSRHEIAAELEVRMKEKKLITDD